MAESHLQLNHDGTTSTRKTCLWPPQTSQRKEIILHLFEQNNWHVTSINYVSGAHWKLKVESPKEQYKINLYISSIRDESRQPDEFKMQLGNTYPVATEEGWLNLVLGIYVISEEGLDDEYILSGYDINGYNFSTNPSIRGTRTSGLQKAHIFGMYSTEKSILFRPEFLYYYISQGEKIELANNLKIPTRNKEDGILLQESRISFLSALRTKPFMLLAGISGTGKSRIVREFAFKSCPEELQDADGTTPGNYCMVEVKPNWHDSTELLGYWSNINNKYMFTKFVKFLVKAMMYPNVPFFVCLDEMNLAPVEQYFAEFLSVLETRRIVETEDEDGEIYEEVKSGVLVDKEYFQKFGAIGNQRLEDNRQVYFKLFDINDREEMDKVTTEGDSLLTEGLTLPENVFIVGTVNMDDTTHQFSRKVIDRAMTIEMNGGALADIFKNSSDLAYTDTPLTMEDLCSHYVSASEVLEKCYAVVNDAEISNYIQGKGEDGLPQRLEQINKVLNGTPFTVSYRVMNELTIYLAVLLDQATDEGKEVDFDTFKQYVDTAIDKILLMKILPRVEGDDEMFNISANECAANSLPSQVEENGMSRSYTKLDWLRSIAPQHTEENVGEYMAVDKLDEMTNRLFRQNFTRYWP